jgi:AraC family transcriptional regulator, regulatory protein of adaptative response / methylated-DNA-[protein]-cysteine methyltransferase
MIESTLPPTDEMLRAFLARDPAYEGVFVTAVRTTGIFCRPTCPARRPRPDHVEFFASPHDAMFAGYRPCRRCRPLETAGEPPAWLLPLLDAVESDPERRWSDADLRAAGLSPERVRRWFAAAHGMTFHAFCRAARLGAALRRIGEGGSVTAAAFDHGWESLSGFTDASRRAFGKPPGQASRRLVPLATRRILTPLGPMVACATDGALCLLEFADRRMLERQLRRLSRRLGATLVPRTNAVLEAAARELEAYFAGRLTTFSVPIDQPGSEFQQAVWAALRAVAFGRTVSYGDLAGSLTPPSHARAVGRANGDNAVAIIVPCHRVVGADGGLTGYGGGLWRKRRLLDHEAAVAGETVLTLVSN